MTKLTQPCQTCTYNNHLSYVKLIISRDSTVEFRMIDFIENIPIIKDNFCPGGTAKSVLALVGDNSRIFLLECTCEISCSPFINALYITYGKVFYGNTHFKRHINCKKDKIFLVGADKGWNWGGKVYIMLSGTKSDLLEDKFCDIYDENNKNQKIELCIC